MESILTSIKKLLGITKEYEHFDDELIVHINSVFATLNQLGVGPAEGFRIKDEDATWDEFIRGEANIESVRTYVYLNVKLLFDNSTLSSAVIAATERQIDELEWRLNVAAETTQSE